MRFTDPVGSATVNPSAALGAITASFLSIVTLVSLVLPPVTAVM